MATNLTLATRYKFVGEKLLAKSLILGNCKAVNPNQRGPKSFIPHRGKFKTINA